MKMFDSCVKIFLWCLVVELFVVFFIYILAPDNFLNHEKQKIKQQLDEIQN